MFFTSPVDTDGISVIPLVEYTPTQPETNRNILSPRNEMHFTNRLLME